MIELYLPYPVSVNNYYGHNKHTVYLKSSGRDYHESVRREVSQQLPSHQVILKEFQMEITVYPPKLKRKRDLDNLLKCLLDSMQRANVFKDDSLIQRLSIEWYQDNDDKGSGVGILILGGR
jgi:crossover junction endodeoxyribonuclease RusA